jgi:RNA polymerase sigma-70 factor (ECF subfamily)
MIATTDISSSFPPGHAATGAADRAATSRQKAVYDAGLVRRFNAGDESAFAEIVARHRDQMFSIAFAMLHNHADAEEIAQDTFVRAHRALANFRGEASLATWLHRIALNLARNRYWYFFRRRRHATLSFDCPLGEGSEATFLDVVATDAADPARAAVAGEFSELVAACMQRLGTRAREILTLRNSLNHSYEEIARELGLSAGTVKSRIARSRERLRVLLAEACPEFGPDARPAAWLEPVRPSGGIEVICA